MAEQSLTQRVRSGVFWTAASSFLTQCLALGRSIVLARLLSRDSFGLFEMAATILGALSVLTNLSLDGSVIADQSDNDAETTLRLNTIWTVDLGRRFLLTLLLLASVYPTARFYGEPRLVRLLPIFSLIPLVEGLRNIGLLWLRKQVRFARIAWYDQTCNLIFTVVTIALAWWTRNVWALVVGQLVSSTLNVLLSYAFYRYRPRFAFDPASFRRAFHFGKYILLTGVADYVMTTADNILVGRLLGASVLGAYWLAYSMANIPVQALGGGLSSVLFPAYAEVGQQSQERLARVVVRVVEISSVLLVLVVVPMALLADELPRLLYGAKWSLVGPLLRILIFQGLFQGLIFSLYPLLIGLNRPDLSGKIQPLEAVLFLVLLYPLTVRFGAAGAAWAAVIVSAVTFFNRYRFCRMLVPQAGRRIPGILCTALLAGAGGWLAGQFLLHFVASALLRILVGGTISLSVTALLLLGMKPGLLREVRETLRRS